MRLVNGELGPKKDVVRESRVWRGCRVTAIAAYTVFACSGATAGEISLGSEVTGGSPVSIHVKSFQALRFSSTVHQQRDYSCGSAALATLLTYGYDLPVTENAILTDMMKHGDKQRIKEYGFSLLDMKEYLQRHGLAAGGFRAPLSKLGEVGIPAIVLINHDGYKHFVVIRGIRNGRVLLSDPSLGVRTVSVPQLEREWNGIFFLVITHASSAQRMFNKPDLWARAPRAPSELARFQIDLMGPRGLGMPDASRF
jgi:uncharacterized protein